MKEEDFKNLCISRAEKCPCCDQKFENPRKIIENEYGDLFTIEEFKQIFEECPIQYTHTIGEYFG